MSFRRWAASSLSWYSSQVQLKYIGWEKWIDISMTGKYQIKTTLFGCRSKQRNHIWSQLNDLFHKKIFGYIWLGALTTYLITSRQRDRQEVKHESPDFTIKKQTIFRYLTLSYHWFCFSPSLWSDVSLLLHPSYSLCWQQLRRVPTRWLPNACWEVNE